MKSKRHNSRLRVLRRARGLSEATLALYVGVTQQHIARIELGRTRGSMKLRQRIAQVLGVPERLL